MTEPESIAYPRAITYFGCLGHGHFWYTPRGEMLAVLEAPGPFRGLLDIDSGFAPNRKERDGDARLSHYQGWTVLSWWDNTADSRGGSHSTFVAEGEWSFDAMLYAARVVYPQVILRRNGKPVVLVQSEGAAPS